MTDSVVAFADVSQIELLPPETVLEWGKTLIVAPHPDDESLGCGGAIALLRKFDQPVLVLTLSDGTLSHPNSVEFPPAKLRNLREQEMINALEILGVSSTDITFLRFRDRDVPQLMTSRFADAVKQVKSFLEEFEPQTIFVPWRRDPHPDHRAAWQILNAAANELGEIFRVIEYPIWLWELADKTDLPQTSESKVWRLDINETVALKQSAILAHCSQTTDLIKDDPDGFRLSSDVLAHFSVPWETYLEKII